MNQEFHVHSTIDRNTFSDFSFFNCFRIHNRFISFLAFPVLMLICGYVNLVTGSPFLFWLFTAIGLIFPVGYLFFYRVSLKNQIQRNQLSTPRLAYTVHITADAIHVRSPTEETSFHWDQIYRVYSYKSYIYLYITKARAFILPYKDIEDGTAEDLWNCITSHTDPLRVRTRLNKDKTSA